MIPVPWVAPVWAPVAVSVVLMLTGLGLTWCPLRPLSKAWLLLAYLAILTGAGLIQTTFFLQTAQAFTTVPTRFDSLTFLLGLLLSAAGILCLLNPTAVLRRS